MSNQMSYPIDGLHHVWKKRQLRFQLVPLQVSTPVYGRHFRQFFVVFACFSLQKNFLYVFVDLEVFLVKSIVVRIHSIASHKLLNNACRAEMSLPSWVQKGHTLSPASVRAGARCFLGSCGWATPSTSLFVFTNLVQNKSNGLTLGKWVLSSFQSSV